jgi:hypothetical protein
LFLCLFFSGYSSSDTACAVALGDLLGDAVEVLLFSRRYTGGGRGVLAVLMPDLIGALFYLRLLLLKKNTRFGSALQSFALVSVPPLWLLTVARTKWSLRVSYLFVVVVIGSVVLPRLWRELNESQEREVVQSEQLEKKLHRGLVVALMGFFGIKAFASIVMAFK